MLHNTVYILKCLSRAIVMVGKTGAVSSPKNNSDLL